MVGVVRMSAMVNMGWIMIRVPRTVRSVLAVVYDWRVMTLSISAMRHMEMQS